LNSSDVVPRGTASLFLILNLNFRNHINFLNRKTICFSKNEKIHADVIGMCYYNCAFATVAGGAVRAACRVGGNWQNAG
jgi:hypothetical protein